MEQKVSVAWTVADEVDVDRVAPAIGRAAVPRESVPDPVRFVARAVNFVGSVDSHRLRCGDAPLRHILRHELAEVHAVASRVPGRRRQHASWMRVYWYLHAPNEG